VTLSDIIFTSLFALQRRPIWNSCSRRSWISCSCCQAWSSFNLWRRNPVWLRLSSMSVSSCWKDALSFSTSILLLSSFKGFKSHKWLLLRFLKHHLKILLNQYHNHIFDGSLTRTHSHEWLFPNEESQNQKMQVHIASMPMGLIWKATLA